MQPIAQYPLNPEAIKPHFGRPVAMALADGEMTYGIVDRIHEGHLVLKPYEGPTAGVQQFHEQIKSHPQIQSTINRAKASMQREANISGYPGYGYGHGYGHYPYGWGYGNYGWGAGWWLIWPLFFIAALFAFPFFW